MNIDLNHPNIEVSISKDHTIGFWKEGKKIVCARRNSQKKYDKKTIAIIHDNVINAIVSLRLKDYN